ncbi:MAG: hypothetical protein ACM3XR_08910 [Bacillota bacterium]
MKKEELKLSFDQIKPSESDKKRMLDNILKQYERKQGFSFIAPYNYKKAIPALALAVAIVVGSLAYYSISRNSNYVTPPGEIATNDAGLTGREDMAAPLLNQFRIDDRHYILLYDDIRAEYGLPDTINESDIGEKIADIATSPDKSLIGCEVYSYIPAGSEAVVAVKRENGYQLFQFFVFESYNNNQDEDSARYLALYGIDEADDIAKIQFIVHSEQSKLEGRTDVRQEITDRDEIEKFYGFYSKLKNSSDKYFDKLFNFNDAGGGSAGGVEIDAVDPGLMPPEESAPDRRVPADKAGSGMSEPGDAGPDMMAPDRAGFGANGFSEPQPPDMPVGRAAIAEDMPLVITDDAETGAASASGGSTGVVSGDTPVSSGGAGSEPTRGMMDMGNPGPGAVEPSRGAAINALANMVTIRIYNRNGIFYESAYYVNIGFINRYEVSKEFADYLSKYIG